MRSSIVSTLLAGTLATLAIAGCSAAPEAIGEGDSSSTSEEAITKAHLKKQLPGDYESEAFAPRFSLDEAGTYSFDTGIRCITTPCPSGDVGSWDVYKYYGDFYVYLLSSDGKVERWLRVDSKKETLVSLTGVYGADGIFEKRGTEDVSKPQCAPETREKITLGSPGVTFAF
jgi:hypothetical protein